MYRWPCGIHHRQSPIRTGLTKVGLPGAPECLKKEDPTIAELLKPLIGIKVSTAHIFGVMQAYWPLLHPRD